MAGSVELLANSFQVYAGSIPNRRLSSATSGDAIYANTLRAASGDEQLVEIPAEKTVSIWIEGGRRPSTSMPSKLISSLNCWKPSSHSPFATKLPTGKPGGGITIRL